MSMALSAAQKKTLKEELIGVALGGLAGGVGAFLGYDMDDWELWAIMVPTMVGYVLFFVGDR